LRYFDKFLYFFHDFLELHATSVLFTIVANVSMWLNILN